MGRPVLEGNQLEMVSSTFIWYSNSSKSLLERFFFFKKKKKGEGKFFDKREENMNILLVHKMGTFMLRVSQGV